MGLQMNFYILFPRFGGRADDKITALPGGDEDLIALIVEGKADKPVYLWIHNDQVELRDASHLWGRTVEETDTTLKKEHQDPDIRVACIGPAGENKVRFASIQHEMGHGAGRTMPRQPRSPRPR